MRPRIFAALVLSFLVLALVKTDHPVAALDERASLQQDFRERLQKLAPLSPDPCVAPAVDVKDWNPADNEPRLFLRAQEIVTDALNSPAAGSNPPKKRVEEALKNLEDASNEINTDWPADNRFHFQVLDVSPILVVQMAIRTSATYFVFAVPNEEVSAKASPVWQEVGRDGVSLERGSARSLVELFELQRSPSGRARFLASIRPFGCAGSVGVVYEAYEWNPEGVGSLEQIIKQEGAFGLSDDVEGFPQIGELQTKGLLVTLPYCQFSAIDTWDNPSLCVVDTYDLSNDKIKFQSRTYNRPDLLPVAKAIEYAQNHEYAALLGYCASAEVADRLVRQTPANSGAEQLEVTSSGEGRERVELGESGDWFDVEKRASGWVVVDFRIE